MKTCFCGPVRNCGKYLDKVFANIEKLGSLFEDYKICIFYDKSDDNTLEVLKKYQNKNTRLFLFVNKTFISNYRTHRLAYARNFCLDFIKNNCPLEEYPYFFMMDFDDVNCKHVNPEILKKYLHRDDWDGLSFNTSPKYYDIWALSIYPYCFSYNHFKNIPGLHDYYSIQTFITNKLNNLNKDELLKCISSFNGFSIYRANKFLNCLYDGRIRVDLLPKSYLLAHAKAAKSGVIFPDLNHVKAFHEDCEHRAFHLQAINDNNAKIRISPEVLFF
jgi:hypothetical protein